jgi:hypothetical protein
MYWFYFAHQTAVSLMALAPKGKEALPMAVALVRANNNGAIGIGKSVFAHTGSIIAHTMITAVCAGNT